MTAAFHRDGFLHVPGALPVPRVAAVLADARQVFVDQMPAFGIEAPAPDDEPALLRAMAQLFEADRATFIHCGKTVQHLVSLHRLGLDERILDLIQQLGVQRPNICTRPVLYFNHPDLAEREVFHKTPAHQDWSSMQGSLNAVVVWVPLIDLVAGLGPVEVVPGSHLLGLQPFAIEDGFGVIAEPPGSFQSVPVQAGDLVVFSAFLVHRSGLNVSECIRWSCHFRFNDLSDPTFIARHVPNPYRYGPLPEVVTPGFPDPALLQAYHEARAHRG